MSELLTIAMATELTETEVDGVLRLVADAEAVDRIKTLNEAAVLRLRRPHPTTQHLLVSEGEQLVGYAQLESGIEWSAGQLWSLPTIGGGDRHFAAAAADHGVEQPVAGVGDG